MNRTALRRRSPEAEAFRAKILNVCGSDVERFQYVDKDTCVPVCPVCDGPLAIRFHDAAVRANLDCYTGCTEAKVLATLRRFR